MLPIVRTDFQFNDIFSAFFNSFNKRNNAVEEVENYLETFTQKKYNLFFPKLRHGMESTFNVLFNNKTIGIPTYTCSVVPHSILLSGNTVEFFDCNSNNLTTEVFKGDLESYIVTPWYGSPLDNKITHSKYAFGDFSHVNIFDGGNFINNDFLATFYSFGAGKPISSIGGGLVSTNNKNLYEDLLNKRTHDYGTNFKTFYLSELIFALTGSFLGHLRLERIKTNLDDKGYLDWLREPLNEVSLGGEVDNISLLSIEMFRKNSKLNKNNNIKVFKFWNKLLKNFPIEILTNKEWSLSHMNVKTKDRSLLQNKLNQAGVQASSGVNYLSHNLKPYKEKHLNNDFPNAMNYLNHLIQLPINLSTKNYNKLLAKEKNIITTLERIFK